MEPLKRLNTTTLFITTAIAIPLLKILGESRIDVLMQGFIGVSAVTGIYKIILFLVKTILEYFRDIKKIIYDKYFFDGIWVGYYISNGKKYYYVECFEQDIESLRILGMAFDEAGKIFTKWISEKVSIDINNNLITYNYTLDDDNNTWLSIGQARFTIVKNKGNEKPKLMRGYTCNIHNNKKIVSVEMKLKKETNLDDITREYIKNLLDKNGIASIILPL